MTARRTAAALAAAALALTACTSQVGGQAAPSTPATGSATPPTGSATTDPDNPFAGLSPCTIIDQALAGQDYPKAEPLVANPKTGCRTTKPTSGDSPGVDIGLSLDSGRGYKENVGNPSQASEGNVNGRPAVMEREPMNSPGQCDVWLEVKPNSRAFVLLASGSDTAKACQLVEDVAAKIEPLLPKN
ncbi:DUF3558 family protein [Amycolatopsis sp. NPDC098790]|uniref:DUF3558 family protein n=1 Tax=Amycolatopsis sp. NPDC098790 TaxID=3363939 RepID=UPI003818B97A